MAKAIAYPIMVLSALGVLLCFSLYLLGLAGIYSPPTQNLPVLFIGVFVVWMPTVLLMNRLTKEFKQKDIWKAALRGCPPWMRTTMYVLIGFVFVVFFLPVLSKGNPGASPQTFVLFPITFYSISFCVMYSVLHVDKFDSTRRCLNGHAISPLAKFCEECGAPAAPDPVNSATISR
jgi:uncharacterized membrane protein